MGIQFKALFLAALLASSLASSARGASVTLTMTPGAGEVAASQDPSSRTCDPSPCTIDGLVVTKGGISFTFSDLQISGSLLQYNLPGTGSETFVKQPVIGGRSQNFSVAFSVAVSNIQFGFSVDSSSAVASMATVALFNNNVQITTFELPSSMTDPAAEGQFTYNGSLGPVTSMSITPHSTVNGVPIFGAVVFDNLQVTEAPVGGGVGSVPAASPLSLAIAAICLTGLTMLLLRKQRA
jgi:hypothetical protein